MTELQSHAFLPDPSVAYWDGTTSCCICPMPPDHPVHDVDVPAGAAEIDARVLGEYEGEQ